MRGDSAGSELWRPVREAFGGRRPFRDLHISAGQSRGLAEAHGAVLAIDSRPGRGTTVTVSFSAERVSS